MFFRRSHCILKDFKPVKSLINFFYTYVHITHIHIHTCIHACTYLHLYIPQFKYWHIRVNRHCKPLLLHIIKHLFVH